MRFSNQLEGLWQVPEQYLSMYNQRYFDLCPSGILTDLVKKHWHKDSEELKKVGCYENPSDYSGLSHREIERRFDEEILHIQGLPQSFYKGVDVELWSKKYKLTDFIQDGREQFMIGLQNYIQIVSSQRSP
ncbi:hypothetical protein HZB02_03355 [Candidatus Woesearchaeota archaeon]|nr:hypothetical protein [Candidatus Woesearchaeota archaeon]